MKFYELDGVNNKRSYVESLADLARLTLAYHRSGGLFLEACAEVFYEI